MADENESEVEDSGDPLKDQAQKRARQALLARKAAERDKRLKEQLRANLQRRKLQSRARREGDEDDRSGDLVSAPSKD